MNRTWTVTIGFALFVIGLLSMILKLVGMQFVFMRIFQQVFGSMTFVVYLVLCLGGILTVFLSFDSTKRVE